MDFDLKKTAIGNSSTIVQDYTISGSTLQGVTQNKESIYFNSNWNEQWAFFNENPDLHNAILLKAAWVVGGGYNCDSRTKVILDNIYGWGKDSILDILFNMEVVKRIGGNSYAEIVWDDNSKPLEQRIPINIKPLDPGYIIHIVDEKGILIRFEQISKVAVEKNKTILPENMLYFSNNRMADQLGGNSEIDVLKKTILADEESFDDQKKVNHRQARPLIIFTLKTDNDAQRDAVISKIDEGMRKGDNVYITADPAVINFQVVQVSPSQIMMEWRNDIRKRFYRSVGLPELIPSGGGDSTESGGKIGYLTFERLIEREQLTVENQIWNQLFLKISLNAPASISSDLQQDASKDGSMQQIGFQPSDSIAGVGR